jgi:NAD(P)-dependent dehydrogenase (short-subunit alcohol dehydrogenase family)
VRRATWGVDDPNMPTVPATDAVRRATLDRAARRIRRYEMVRLEGPLAGAKHALRAMAHSMARELGPLGVHVAHVRIDGAINTTFIRGNFPQRYALKKQDGILNPDPVADPYWMLHLQPRDAWTHERDLRPWIEKF